MQIVITSKPFRTASSNFSASFRLPLSNYAHYPAVVSLKETKREQMTEKIDSALVRERQRA